MTTLNRLCIAVFKHITNSVNDFIAKTPSVSMTTETQIDTHLFESQTCNDHTRLGPEHEEQVSVVSQRSEQGRPALLYNDELRLTFHSHVLPGCRTMPYYPVPKPVCFMSHFAVQDIWFRSIHLDWTAIASFDPY